MKPMLRGIAVAVAAVGVAACVKQAWRVTYPGPDNYSGGTAVLVEDNGKSYMAGNFNPGAAFLAAYSASGKLLWDRVIEGDGLMSIPGTRLLEQDSAGNLYMLQSDSEFQNILFKFDADGNQLASIPLQGGQYLSHMQLLNGVLYLSSGIFSPSQVNAYDLDGNLLWSYVPAGQVWSGDRDLPQYPGVATGAASVSSAYSGGHSMTHGGVHKVTANELVYFNQVNEIVALDTNGVVANSVSALSLGIEEIHGLIDNGAGLIVLGLSGSSLVSIAVNANLEEMSRSDLHDQAIGNTIASSKGEVLCAGFHASDAEGNRTFDVMQLSVAGEPLWSKSMAVDWEYFNASLLSDGKDCYLTTTQVQRDNDNRLLTRTERYDAAGAVTGAVDLPDFGVTGVAINGKGIYHTGITGEYDNSVTIATLDRKPLK